MLDGLDDDVARAVFRRLSLWDARSLVLVCPSLAHVLADEVDIHTREGAALPHPTFLETFLESPPSFQERCAGGFVMLRTPLDLTVHSCDLGVTVEFRRSRGLTRVAVRVVDPAVRPTLRSLSSAIARVTWFSKLASVDVYRTRASLLHPPTELLNVVVSKYVDRVLEAYPL